MENVDIKSRQYSDGISIAFETHGYTHNSKCKLTIRSSGGDWARINALADDTDVFTDEVTIVVGGEDDVEALAVALMDIGRQLLGNNDAMQTYVNRNAEL